jgi:hypothetical protein
MRIIPGNPVDVLLQLSGEPGIVWKSPRTVSLRLPQTSEPGTILQSLVVKVLLPLSRTAPRFILNCPMADTLLQQIGQLAGIRKSLVVLLLIQWSGKVRTIPKSPVVHEMILLLQSNV